MLVRRLLLATASLLLATATLTSLETAQAGSSPDRPTAREASAARALARADAALEGRGDATLALRDLALRRSDLSGADRRRADRVLARPTDPGDPDVSYSTEEVQQTCSEVVCVHWVETTDDAADPGYADQVLALLDQVHTTFVEAGYRAPKADEGLGGSDLIDVYLADIGSDGLYGYCASDEDIADSGPYDAWAYCVLDNDYSRAEFPTNSPTENLQVTVAHEYFHAVQFGYDLAEDAWLLEATAAWVEDELFDEVDDNVQYLARSPLSHATKPLDRSNGLAVYGGWIFFRYLSDRFPDAAGELPLVVRQVFERTDAADGAPDDYSLAGLDRVLRERGTSLATVFGEFAEANRRPGETYDEGTANRYPSPRRYGSVTLGRNDSTNTGRVRLDHLSSTTARFTPGPDLTARSWQVRIKVNLASRSRGSAAFVTVYRPDGTHEVTALRLDNAGDVAQSFDFSSRDISFVDLTLVNASHRFRCFSGGPYSCSGTAKDDGVTQRFSARTVR